MASRRILVTGATGFIGRRLVPSLLEQGHEVLAATRRPGDYRGPGRPLAVDLADTRQLAGALDGCEVAYFLVHSLNTVDFTSRDRELAERFATTAAGRVDRVVYLGGLGRRGKGSAHLRSRHEVGDILSGAVPTVELRAALVLGEHSASYELLRQVVARLTTGPGPRIVPGPIALSSRTQPIDVADAVGFLVDAADLEPGRYDIGAPEPVRFSTLMELQARVTGRRLKVHPVLPVPARLFAPLSAVLTDQPLLTVHALLLSAGEDTVVEDRRIEALTGRRAAGVEETLRRLAGHPGA